MKEKWHPKPNSKINFTDHQVLIIQLWSECPRIKEIANILELSEQTVQTHLKRMRAKLNVKRTFEVYKYMQENGMI